MAYQKLKSFSNLPTISLIGVDKVTGKKNNPVFEGYYLGKKTIPDKFHAGKEAWIYFFQPKIKRQDGSDIQMYGKTHLNSEMKKAIVGQMMEIKYVGMTPKPKGPMHTFELQTDPANTIVVAAEVTQELPPGNSYVGEQDETVDDDDGDGYETATEPLRSETLVETSAVLKETPAVRQARIQNLLKKKQG